MPNLSYLFSGNMAGFSSILKSIPFLLLAILKWEIEVRYCLVGVFTTLGSEKSIEGSVLLNSFTITLSVFWSNIGASSFLGLLLIGISATLIRSNISSLNRVTPQLKTQTTLKSGLDGFKSSGVIIGFFSDLNMFIFIDPLYNYRINQ